MSFLVLFRLLIIITIAQACRSWTKSSGSLFRLSLRFVASNKRSGRGLLLGLENASCNRLHNGAVLRVVLNTDSQWICFEVVRISSFTLTSDFLPIQVMSFLKIVVLTGPDCRLLGSRFSAGSWKIFGSSLAASLAVENVASLTVFSVATKLYQF